MNGPIDTSPRKSADPVIYHLVRVVDDGTLVPATDDEVVAVENFIEDEKIEGLLPDENLKVDAEKLDLLPDHELDSKSMDVQDQDKNHAHASDAVDQSRSLDEFSKHSDELAENGSSASAVGITLRPDFSLLKGEIHLDNLTIKELQETFKATFGRETSVKDKQWLKRRIIMGLTNSCDFSATTLVIIDNKVVKKGRDESYKCADPCANVDHVVQSSREGLENPTCSDSQREIHSNGTGTKIQSFTMQENCGSKDDDREERPAKRIRKPTRRYIEELSDGESRDPGAKTVSYVKRPSGFDQASLETCVIPENVGLDGRCLLRQDSLGGSGIQVPYVSRIRRCRPRENFMTLMKFQPAGIGLSTKLVKDEVGCSEQLGSENVSKVLEAGLSPRWIEVPISSPGKCRSHTESIQLETVVELKTVKSHSENSDDEVITVPTENGGTRRKHHRPWTLNEVLKLVEGVAKYGAGRWSEIKRSAFASYSYRTSVDLKDKWRNLLRASLAELLPARNEMQTPRKHASVPIPARILVRVRELADIQTKVPPSLNAHPSGGFVDTDGNKSEMGSDRIVVAL